MSQHLDIAIVGLAGVYPRARDARAFWQNILNKVDAVDEGGPEWAHNFYDPSAGANEDRIYTTKGGFLRDLAEFDPLEFGVLPNVAEGSEPDVIMALKHGRDALADAGLLQRGFDPQRVGIVLGRGSYTSVRVLSAMTRGFFIDQAFELIKVLRPDITDKEFAQLKKTMVKDQLTIYNADMVGPMTPNVVAGMVANRLNLMGPNYVVDAACASTLIAVESAVRELLSGRSDIMLVGGVQSSTPPYLFIQFCLISALSRDKIRPFQKGSVGTLLGEGVGMMVLKRLADAERDGDRIYAVIKGIGTSSDGKAKGLLAPRLDGEILALRRAYESCGIDPATISLIEAHGTGTDAGDHTEIQALNAVFGHRGKGAHVAVGAVKSMIGHCLPASASASMIKTSLALHHKILPPTLCEEPEPSLHLEQTPFYINNETRPWIHGRPHPRRAGVNAFGFGGINSHVVLEEYLGPRKTQVSVLHAPKPSELVTLAANSPEALAQLASRILVHLRAPKPATLAEIAKASSAFSRGEHRLAIVCNDVDELIAKVEQAIEKLRKPDVAPFKTRSGVYYGHGPVPGRVCMLFPGEGAQYPNMLADVCAQFPQVREWFDFFERVAIDRGADSSAAIIFPAPTMLSDEERKKAEEMLFSAELGAESVSAAVFGLMALLDDLGVQADAMLGHSTGENLAIAASGLFQYRSREEVASFVSEMKRAFAKFEAEGRIVAGTLLNIGALKPDARRALLANPGPMHVAMDNCPNQLVLFGAPEDATALRQKLSAEGAICAELPFGRAYHTPMFKPVADWYRERSKNVEPGKPRAVLYSACSVGPFPSDADAMRELAAKQWEAPVRFTETAERLYADGVRVFIEVGPSGNLTSFVSDTLRDKDDIVAVASNSRRKSGVQQIHAMLAQIFSVGVGFNPAALYSHREVDTIDLMAAPRDTASRPAMKLNTRIRTLHLPPDWAPLQRKFVPADTVRDAAKPQPGEAESHANVVRLDRAAARKTEPAAPPVPDDPRMAFLRTHFGLMQEFLDSQARVLTGLAMPMSSDTVRSLVQPPAGTSEAFPLLGPVIEQSEGRIVFERNFDETLDVFVNDHAIGPHPSELQPQLRSLQVIPFTFSMEIVAEAAARLVGGPYRVTGMSEIRGHRWLTLDMGKLSLRIVAERKAPQDGMETVSAKIFLLGTIGPPGGHLVFEATVLLAQGLPAAPAPIDWSAKPERPIAVTADADLYRMGMFHGPRLQGVKHLRRWADDAIEADMEVLPTHDYFAFTTRPHLQIDAALLDAVGQLAGYWLAEQHGWTLSCFPFRVVRYVQYGTPLMPGTRVLGRARLERTQIGLEAQFDMIGPDGRVFARLEGWQDRVFEMPERFVNFRSDPLRQALSQPVAVSRPGVSARVLTALPENFLGMGFAIWMRVLAYMVLGNGEREEFYALPATGTRREEWLMGRVAAKEILREWIRQTLGHSISSADIEIRNDANGRPQARCAALPGVALPAISISHSKRWAAAAITVTPQRVIGVDYQRLAGTNVENMLATGFDPSETASVRLAPAAEQSRLAVGLWSAKEAAAKASGHGLGGRPLDWRIAKVGENRGPAEPLHVEIHRGSERYEATVQFYEDAVLAVCEHAAVQANLTPALTAAV
jgi:acyl transferase domain-containing protein/phosphopantetheinyl transferase